MIASRCPWDDTGTCTTIIGRSCHKYNFCRDKNTSFVATKVCLFRRNFCHILSRQKFCRDKYWSRQRFCRNKYTFVATNDVFCRDKHVFVKFCRTSILLSRQTTCFVATHACLSCLSPHTHTHTHTHTHAHTRTHTNARTHVRAHTHTHFCRDKSDTCGSSRQ